MTNLQGEPDKPAHTFGSSPLDARVNPLPSHEGEIPGHQGRSKKRKVKEAEERTRHDGQVFTHNKRGVEICQAWNHRGCGKSDKPQSQCELGCSHQCSSCLGPHQAKVCINPRQPTQVERCRASSRLEEQRPEGKPNPRRSRSPIPRRKGEGHQSSKADRDQTRVSQGPASKSKSKEGVSCNTYGCWSKNPNEPEAAPRCLHLFSGPAREGDLSDVGPRALAACCSPLAQIF